MKTKRFFEKLVSLSFLLVMLMFDSCNNLIEVASRSEAQTTETETTTEKKATLSISVEGGSSRTILAEDVQRNDLSYRLLGKMGWGGDTELASWDSYTDMINDKYIVCDPGSWSFTINASRDGVVLFTARKGVLVQEGENKIQFNMKAADGQGCAEVSFTLQENSGVSKVKAGLLDVSSYAEVNGFGLKELELNGNSFAYNVENVPNGAYVLQVRFYDASGNEIKPGFREVIQIKSGRVSRATREISNLNKYHKINYVYLDKDGKDISSEMKILSVKPGYSIPLVFNEMQSMTLPTDTDFLLDGYDFEGWYTDAACKTPITKIASKTKEDVTVYTKVGSVHVTGVGFENDISYIGLGGSEITLNPVFYPENATNKKVTWKSSDETIAKIDANGVVTAVGRGDATITVKTDDGNYSATCTVKVLGIVEEESDVGIKFSFDTPAVSEYSDIWIGMNGSQQLYRSGNDIYDLTEYEAPFVDANQIYDIEVAFGGGDQQYKLKASIEAEKGLGELKVTNEDEINLCIDAWNFVWIDTLPKMHCTEPVESIILPLWQEDAWKYFSTTKANVPVFTNKKVADKYTGKDVELDIEVKYNETNYVTRIYRPLTFKEGHAPGTEIKITDVATDDTMGVSVSFTVPPRDTYGQLSLLVRDNLGYELSDWPGADYTNNFYDINTYEMPFVKPGKTYQVEIGAHMYNDSGTIYSTIEITPKKGLGDLKLENEDDVVIYLDDMNHAWLGGEEPVLSCSVPLDHIAYNWWTVGIWQGYWLGAGPYANTYNTVLTVTDEQAKKIRTDTSPLETNFIVRYNGTEYGIKMNKDIIETTDFAPGFLPFPLADLSSETTGGIKFSWETPEDYDYAYIYINNDYITSLSKYDEITEYTYPFVDVGNVYSVEVRFDDSGSHRIGTAKGNITAKSGIGESQITNLDDIKVYINDDNYVWFDAPQVSSSEISINQVYLDWDRIYWDSNNYYYNYSCGFSKNSNGEFGSELLTDEKASRLKSSVINFNIYYNYNEVSKCEYSEKRATITTASAPDVLLITDLSDTTTDGIKFSWEAPADYYRAEIYINDYYYKSFNTSDVITEYTYPFVNIGETYSVEVRFFDDGWNRICTAKGKITAQSGFGENPITNLDDIKVYINDDNYVWFDPMPELSDSRLFINSCGCYYYYENGNEPNGHPLGESYNVSGIFHVSDVENWKSCDYIVGHFTVAYNDINNSTSIYKSINIRNQKLIEATNSAPDFLPITDLSDATTKGIKFSFTPPEGCCETRIYINDDTIYASSGITEYTYPFVDVGKIYPIRIEYDKLFNGKVLRNISTAFGKITAQSGIGENPITNLDDIKVYINNENYIWVDPAPAVSDSDVSVNSIDICTSSIYNIHANSNGEFEASLMADDDAAKIKEYGFSLTIRYSYNGEEKYVYAYNKTVTITSDPAPTSD